MKTAPTVSRIAAGQVTPHIVTLCDYASTSDDGKLSLNGIFSTLTFTSLPNAARFFYVAVLDSVGAEAYEAQVGMLDTNGTAMLPDSHITEISSDVQGTRSDLVVDFNSMPFNQAGTHHITLSIGGTEIHRLPFTVRVGH